MYYCVHLHCTSPCLTILHFYMILSCDTYILHIDNTYLVHTMHQMHMVMYYHI